MIVCMNTLLVLLLITMIAVVGVLIFGLIAMAKGGEFNEKYGNRMMRWRVAIQAFAVVLIVIFVIAASKGG
jgi:ABC-type dipeptide/oligopeptide/nickel transport system permease component